MAEITGRVEIIVDGVTLLNKSGATASGIGLSGKPNYELEGISGDTGIHGYVERPVVARCEVPVTDRSDIELNTFAEINGNGTIIFRKAGGNGKTYTMDGATCLRNFTLTAGDGEVSLIFEGPYWTETTAG
jgi:hypothetical protein